MVKHNAVSSAISYFDEQIAALSKARAALVSLNGNSSSRPRRRHLSKQALQNIRQAQLKRWAAFHKARKARKAA